MYVYVYQYDMRWIHVPNSYIIHKGKKKTKRKKDLAAWKTLCKTKKKENKY